jgi:hypothetical protein
MALESGIQFQNPSEEVAFLRERLASLESSSAASPATPEQKHEQAREVIREYQNTPAQEVLHETHAMPEHEAGAIALRLHPETHDDTIGELFALMQAKGIKNALTVLEKMQNPHLEDDFHRFLVQYLSEVHEIPGLNKERELSRSLDMALFLVTVPERSDTSFRDRVSLMEQFYAGMMSLARADDPDRRHISIEFAVQNSGEALSFYVSVPRGAVSLFEKQLLGIFHNARLEEITDDYNLFTPGGTSSVLLGKAIRADMLTIKTYESFQQDPMEVIAGAFSKLRKDGEGCALQIIVRPAHPDTMKQFSKALDQIKKGEKLESVFSGFSKSVGSEASLWGKTFVDTFFGGSSSSDSPKSDDKKIDDEAISSVMEKLKSTLVETNIRIVASAADSVRADAIARDIAAAFQQFQTPAGAGFTFDAVPARALPAALRDFTYRNYEADQKIVLNFHELSTISHLPEAVVGSAALVQARAITAPLPIEMRDQGILLGMNDHRGDRRPVHFAPNDRLRHFYTIGQTGVGKTQLFLNMIIQDIKNGEGVCYIDPHGSDINTILANIPPERIDDVIYFDPAHIARPMGLNFLEYDIRYPEQKSLVVSELFSIFNKLFDMKSQGGAMFGQYFRNSALLVMEDPESGNTLLEITRVLANKEFRQMKLSKCKNPIITEFWKTAEQTTGDQSLANFVPYISSKFDDFISNEIMRPVVLQEHSSFNFRKVMDEKKILLVNLSKGRLGEQNASLIGLVLVGKLQMAAMSRADAIDPSVLPPFYVYIDEFQNVVTDSISAILSEARKYKLVLNLTHQYLGQLPENIKAAVFGNVGSMGVFRINDEDAKFMEPRFAPVVSAQDILRLDNMNAYVSMLVDGRPAKAFSLKMDYVQGGNKEHIAQMKELSYLKFGRPREEIEAEIAEKYRTM